MSSNNNIKRYIVETNEGVFRFSVPETWRVTFSGVNPSRSTNYESGYCLRIYESSNKQRAVITNVKSFVIDEVVIEQANLNGGVAEWVKITPEIFLLGAKASKLIKK